MFDDYEDEEGPDTGYGPDRDRLEKAKKEFISGCYDAYELLANDGASILAPSGMPSIKKAINRMTAYFTLVEEFERCGFLQKFVKENIPGFEIEPDMDIPRQLNIF